MEGTKVWHWKMNPKTKNSQPQTNFRVYLKSSFFIGNTKKRGIHCIFIQMKLARSIKVYMFYLCTLDRELAENSHQAVNEICALLHERIDQHDSSFNKGILTLAKRVKEFGPGVLNSAIHSFGSAFIAPACRGKIGTQPGAGARRKGKSRSRQKQDTRGENTKRQISDAVLPLRKEKRKRPHDITTVVEQNVPAAKKSGADKMKSNTKCRKTSASKLKHEK